MEDSIIYIIENAKKKHFCKVIKYHQLLVKANKE